MINKGNINMKIEIHSFHSIEKFAKNEFEAGTALISIGDTDAQPPQLKHRPEFILRLVFDDISPGQIKAMHNTHAIFSDKQAERVADFVLKNKSKINTLICQCEFGQSRSAGCAAAITEYLYNDGIKIFADDLYSPNKLVYKKVLKALENKERANA